MTRIIEIIDDLLTTDIQYIAHQCNCLTQHSAGTAKRIFDEFPYSNVYKNRTIPSELGTIKICGNGKDQRFIVNMFAQYYPGRAKFPNGSKDNPTLRINAFKECLRKVEKLPGLLQIAFPYKIGCNLGGGDWSKYKQMLEEFAERIYPFIDVYIIKLNKSLW